MNVFFDNAATTKIHPKVLEKMIPFLGDEFGNPSSIHSYGRRVRVAIEEARELIADYINANASEIYFVSNGTEANNFPLFGISKITLEESGKNKLITSSVEHTCVLETYEELSKHGFETKVIPVSSEGRVNLETLGTELDSNTALVSLIHINNETGAVNDIESFSKIVKNNGSFFHTDAVQSFGKIEIDVAKIGVDSLSASAHKLHGPKGIGMVYVKSGTPLSPMLFGGSQERNRRGGTEFPAGIIGFAEAVKIAKVEAHENFEKVTALRNYFIKSIEDSRIQNVSINCKNIDFPYILSLTFNSNYYNNDSEAMLMFLDFNGIAASNGAACTSGTLKPSHVIINMGRTTNDALGTIRFSFSTLNNKDEVDYTVEKLEQMSKKFLK